MDKQKFLDALLGLLAIDSVAYVDVDETHPYGKPVAEALDYTLALAEDMGMRTVNRDGKVAWVEMGEGDEMVGILAHLDIVPIGDGWTYSPYGELVGDRLYGRGTSDDKGPTMAALFAMKDLLDSNVKLNRRVRLILGQCEEVGEWTDMQYYAANEELPVFGFTPDAEFPAIYGEKHIMSFTLTMPLADSGLDFAEGGDAGNMVPGWAKAVVDGKEYAAEGIPGHAATPEKGLNAISKLMADLPGKYAEFYNKHIGFDYNGGLMGCGFEDEQSGKLTLNAGLLRTEGDQLVQGLNIRCPISFTLEQVTAAIEAACAPYGITVTVEGHTPGIYMDKQGKVISTMMEVYRQVTGDMTEPMVIGGGTYARAMPGIVAYGPQRPGRETTEHQKNEYILLQDLLDAVDIYRIAIEKLANLEL